MVNSRCSKFLTLTKPLAGILTVDMGDEQDMWDEPEDEDMGDEPEDEDMWDEPYCGMYITHAH